MEYLFSINKKGTLLFHPDAMKLCPEFAFLDDKERLALVLIVDHYSPFHQLPESDRRLKAALQVFNDNDVTRFEKTIFKNAINMYQSLQFDTKREMIKIYKDKLVSLSNDLKIATSSTAIKNILDSQDKIQKTIAALSNELIEQMEMRILRGGGSLSFIEELTANQEAYTRTIALKK